MAHFVRSTSGAKPASHVAHAPERSPAPATPFEQRSFDELLQLVSRGQLSSGRPVDLGFAPRSEITDDQLARLASAADLAEAEGARTALMLVDGRGHEHHTGVAGGPSHHGPPRHVVSAEEGAVRPEMPGQHQDVEIAAVIRDEHAGRLRGRPLAVGGDAETAQRQA